MMSLTALWSLTAAILTRSFESLKRLWFLPSEVCFGSLLLEFEPEKQQVTGQPESVGSYYGGPKESQIHKTKLLQIKHNRRFPSCLSSLIQSES